MTWGNQINSGSDFPGHSQSFQKLTQDALLKGESVNDSTSVSAQASELVALRRKCQLLMRMVLGINILWLGAAVLMFFAGSTRASETITSTTTVPVLSAESLRVREIVVVDANGTPRVRIAAPLPDPIMLGKRFKRGGSVSGILLYDAEGNERGGYVTDEERNVALTLDEINRQAVTLAVNDRGEMYLRLANGRGGYAAIGVLPSGAWFRLDKPGQPATLLPDTPGGAPN